MSDEGELDSRSFNSNYKVLRETADWLARQDEPDIDQLVPKVERAMRAYRICRDRLQAVQETLGHYLADGREPDGARPPADGDGRLPRPAAAVDGDGEGDIPF